MNRQVTWPRSRPEADNFASQVSQLMDAPIVAILMGVPQELNGVHAAPELNWSQVELEAWVQFAKNFVKKADTELDRIRRIQLATSLGPGIQNLTWVQFGMHTAPRPVVYGALVLATRRVMSPQEEIGFLTVAHHLGELARKYELETTIQQQNQFLSIASHELKTPLTSIYGILQLQARMLKASKDGSTPIGQDRYEHFLQMSIRQVERLNELIDGLLDVSRIQNGRFSVEPTETRVPHLLFDCLQSRLQIIGQEAGVTIQVDAPQELVAWVDPVRFEELVTNLVMNAIRFSPEGGVVWVRLSEEPTGFRLTVRDQGPSVPQEDRERLFQPFERAQRTSRLGGLGLGLFISRQIAQLHGGNVSLIESVPGKGNVFEAYFPSRTPRAA